MDTDGDFESLIPLFLEAGIDGFAPMEVAAGMDPVAMREKYGKSFCMFGGVDKREIAKGRRAIDCAACSALRRWSARADTSPASTTPFRPMSPWPIFNTI